MRVRLKEIRVVKGMTQQQLAEMVGVSRQTINYIERGKYKPSVLLALKLAKALGVRVEDIFVLEEGD